MATRPAGESRNDHFYYFKKKYFNFIHLKHTSFFLEAQHFFQAAQFPLSSHFQAARGLTAALRLENVAIFPSSFERRRSSSSAVGVFRGVPQVALLAHRARARRQWTVDETAREL